VEAVEFADPEVRARWLSERGMRVFSMWDPTNPMRSVDLFVENPVEFDELWDRSETLSFELRREGDDG